MSSKFIHTFLKEGNFHRISTEYDVSGESKYPNLSIIVVAEGPSVDSHAAEKDESLGDRAENIFAAPAWMA